MLCMPLLPHTCSTPGSYYLLPKWYRCCCWWTGLVVHTLYGGSLLVVYIVWIWTNAYGIYTLLCIFLSSFTVLKIICVHVFIFLFRLPASNYLLSPQSLLNLDCHTVNRVVCYNTALPFLYSFILSHACKCLLLDNPFLFVFVLNNISFFFWMYHSHLPLKYTQMASKFFTPWCFCVDLSAAFFR